MMERSWCILLVAVSATLRVAHLQNFSQPRSQIGNCPLLTSDDLGTTAMASTTGLVAVSFAAADGATVPQTVRILDYSIVCTSSGASMDTYSTVSVVVSFECSGTVCSGGQRTNQFQYTCGVGNSYTDAEGLPIAIPNRPLLTENPTATLSTARVDQCGECSSQPVNGNDPDPDTHCVGCVGCSGLNMCLGISTLAEPVNCCNHYLLDASVNRCVRGCTSPLVPDNEQFCGCGTLPGVDNAVLSPLLDTRLGTVVTVTCDSGNGYVGSEEIRTCTTSGWMGTLSNCQLATCPLLGDPFGGSVTFRPEETPNTFGATATFSCDEGFVLLGEGTLMCEADQEWSEDVPTCVSRCESGLTVDNGEVTISPDENAINTDSVATFTCDDGFVGGGTVDCGVTGWSEPFPTCIGSDSGSSTGSSCGTGCIVGIVLAILGVIILAAILAGVAYAVYSYMNHPDTKLAKYDPDNINGVAKDNPLYVDPEAVVGAGDGAEAA